GIEIHWRVMRIRLRFDGDDVRLSDLKLPRILDDEDPVGVGNRLAKHIKNRGLSGSRSAADEDCLPGVNLFLKELGEGFGERSPGDQVVNREIPPGEFPDSERRSW